MKSKTDERFLVPCGKCPYCVARRVSSWSFRLLQEDRVSLSSYFLTLTYDTKHIPITRNGFMSVNKADLQKFFKRLRKNQPVSSTGQQKPIKYFAAAEYGGRTSRPHYHIILFNAVLSTIQTAWQFGHINYGTISGASVGYTLKYMSKPPWHNKHKNDDREPEFRLMSKGLGASYITDKMKRWHVASVEDRMYCNLTDGKKIAMPRYYKDKIYTESQRKRAAFFSKIAMDERKANSTISVQQQVASDMAAFTVMYQRNKKLDNL